MSINKARLEIAGESHTGPVRHHNEDSFLIYSPPGGEAVLAVIADGIGGHSRGEQASYLCCRELLIAAKKTPCSEWDREFLCRALNGANEKIFNFNFRSRRVRPMGCTVVAAIFTFDKLIFASAGDSRIYEYNRNCQPAFRQLSKDHRPEGFDALYNMGAFRHTSLVSRSLGTAKELQLDSEELPRSPESKYLLCSDGLYNHLPEQVLSGTLGEDISMRKISGKLLRSALLAGEKDNISVICAATAPDGE